MCLVFLVFGCGPRQPRLLLAFNRDEFFKRPTQPLHVWEGAAGLLAGRDLGSGGTWLGINVRTGRLALLTNLRSRDSIDPSSVQSSSYTSRGELITGFLTGSSSPEDYVQSIPHGRYQGFNLVVGNLGGADPRVGDLVYTNNSTEGDAAVSKEGDYENTEFSDGTTGGTTAAVEQLEPGRVYGLSNGRLMEWPKVASGVQIFRDLLMSVSSGKEVPYDRIFGELLGDCRRLVQRKAAATYGAAIGASGGGGNDDRRKGAAEGSTATQQTAEVDGVEGGSSGAAAAIEEYDAPSFRDQIEHITSGRFVAAVRSPYGMYGTRSQTVVVIWHDGSGEARERYREDDGSWSEVTIPFQLEAG